MSAEGQIFRGRYKARCLRIGLGADDALAVGPIIAIQLIRDFERPRSFGSRDGPADRAEPHRRDHVAGLSRPCAPAPVFQSPPALFEGPNYQAFFHRSALLKVDEQNATVENAKSKVIFETIFARTILPDIANNRLASDGCVFAQIYLYVGLAGPPNFLSSSRFEGRSP